MDPNMAEAQGQGIDQELGFGDIISRTISLFRSNFVKYFIPFVVIELIIGVVTTVARDAITIPSASTISASPDMATALASLFTSVFELVIVIGIVSIILTPIALGTAIKITSDQILNGQADLMTSVRYAASKLLWILIVGFLLGIIVFLGTIAFVIPGIILGIMFCLAIPVTVIEGPGVLASFSRSRELVGHRWLKTFALAIVFGIIVLIASGIASLIGALFGPASSVVSGVLSAFYTPIIPIALTVYYYSNKARISPPMTGAVSMTPGAPVAGSRFCPNCGAPLAPEAKFCPSCGTNLTT
jgi:hypothetical protein